MSTRLFLVAEAGEKIPLTFDFTELLTNSNDANEDELLISQQAGDDTLASPIVNRKSLYQNAVVGDDAIMNTNPAVRAGGKLIDMTVTIPSATAVRGDRILMTVTSSTNKGHRFSQSAEIFIQ